MTTLHDCINKFLLKIFDTLIDSFIADEVGIAENFLSKSLAAHLQENLKTLYQNQLLLHAGTGNEPLTLHDRAVRSDKIYWLDSAHHDRYEDDFFKKIDHFVSYLNTTCYTGITGYEFHYALYEKGSFYKKHLDQFRSNESRKYSMILYLNADWQQGDGGELCIHHESCLQNIIPTMGKSVFFKSSEILHEVLLSNKPRMSITGWLKVN